ncbi:MAG: substrate-binding domain-containing protein, partial [Rhodoferax sp.]
GITHYDPSEEESLLREQLLHRPAGLVVTGLERSEATRSLMTLSGVPCVHLMTDEAPVGAYCVGFSQRDAGRDLTRHLLKKGYQRIAFAAAQLDPRTLQRLEGWRQALHSAGRYEATLEWLNPAPSSLSLGARMFEQIMGQQPAVDAIFFCNDDLAQGALLAALRLGIAVPQRV